MKDVAQEVIEAEGSEPAPRLESSNGEIPLLIGIENSLFCEKVRFALDYKGLPYREKNLLPGLHPWTVRRHGGTGTVPVMHLGDRTLTDSTDILAAVEEVAPQPPLYPADANQRAQALELQDYFDEIGHHVRRMGMDTILTQPDLVIDTFARRTPNLLVALARPAYPLTERMLRRRYDITDQTVRTARVEVRSAFDRIDERLAASSGHYLLGEQLTVADITAASLLGPIVAPEEYPNAMRLQREGRAAAYHAELEALPAFSWVKDIYNRHRKPSAAV
jgi:glutathione S-transferase